MDMVKNDLKCVRCGRRLLRGYSFLIKSIKCSCGCNMTLVHNLDREDFLIENAQASKGKKKK